MTKNVDAVKAGKAMDETVDKGADKKRGAKKVKGPTIASVAYEAIKKGLDNEAVLAEVKKAFPDAKTKMASINWYRNKAREEDPSIPTSRDITTKRTAEKKAKAKADKADKKAASAKKPVDKADKAKADKNAA